MTSFPHADIKATLAASERDAGVRVPGVVLFSRRERPIFVARGDRASQQRALAFFANSPLRRAAGHAMLALHRATRRALPQVQLTLPSQWRTQFDADLDDVAMYCGSPGPLQKVTLYVPPNALRPNPVVVKISLRPTADDVIAHESQVLVRLLQGTGALRQHLPELVSYGCLPSGRRYLATLAGVGAIAPAALSEEHLEFLQSLGHATRRDMPWSSGEAMLRTELRLRRLGPQRIAPDIDQALTHALARVRQRLGDLPVPHVMSHGDFTRYNIRQHVGQFVVFDWEYAQGEANPLADLMHFRLSQPGNWSALTVMHHALASAEQFAATAYADWHPSPRTISALALHALVDTLVFYAAAGDGLDTRSFLVQRYLGLLACVNAWQGT